MNSHSSDMFSISTQEICWVQQSGKGNHKREVSLFRQSPVKTKSLSSKDTESFSHVEKYGFLLVHGIQDSASVLNWYNIYKLYKFNLSR